SFCDWLWSLNIFLEALAGVPSVIPKDKLLAITSAVFDQLSDDTKEHSEADRAELTRCILLQEPMMTEKMHQAVEAVQCLCSDPRIQLLWPRLLLYVVPAQYTGMLIPVSRCVRALAERGDLMVRETEDLDPHFLSSMFQGPLLTPQTLLARLLVVAGSPFAGSELQAAALLLLQNLHSKIHPAVGAMWAAEIPLLLQCLEGQDESFPDSAEWEQRLLKFLRASLYTIEDEAWTKGLSCELSQRLSSSPSSSGEKFLWVSLDTMEDEAWTKGLSCELSRRLSSSPSGSGEKSFLYKALGTVLGACKEILHIQEKLLQHLEEANAEEPSEVQMELESRRAQATHSALILAHGSLALRASKEQLLARLEGDIVGNILLLYSCSCQ
ncbi:hypothetical protein CIB84_013836, partial [Bambusicola thoracicus]